MEDPAKELNDIFRAINNTVTLAFFFVFSVLVVADGWRAFRKRANWFPGKGFALTGVTVQILVWWTSLSNIVLYEVDVETIIYFHQWVVNGRVAICVFIGYLLPGMAAPDFRAFVALAITVCAQIGTEFLSLQASRHHTADLQQDAEISWSKVVDQILFISIILLCLISGCTVLAGKTIRGLLKERISAVFSTDKEEEFHLSTTGVGNERTLSTFWNDFEDESFKSWLAARVCQVDYVISRSVLSSAVGMIVTIPVILFILTNRYHNTISMVNSSFPISIFILIGWVAICWRWLMAKLYFSTHKLSWKRCVYVDDFWTISIVEFIHMYDLKGNRQRSKHYEMPSSKMFRLSRLNGLPTKIFTKLNLHKVLYLLLMLQGSVVLFTKACGLLSEVITGKFMYNRCKCLRKRDQVALPEKYAIFLKCICMPGEDPSDLWQANIRSIDRIRLLMRKGQEKGRKSEQINSKFQHYSLQWGDDGTQLLHKLKKIALPLVLKNFPSVEKRQWKITVVSLMSIIIVLHRAKDVDIVNKASKVSHEIWDLLNFIDEVDIDAHEISLDDFKRDTNPISMAADKEFYRLQIMYEKLPRGSKECVIDIETTRSILDNLSEECKELLYRENLLGETQQNSEGKKFVADLSDSKDWTKIALSYNLYKLCKVMVDDHVEDYAAWAYTSFINVIAACVSKLPDMLVKQCWKLAEGFEEDKLWEAIYLASKVRGMMEAWRLQPQLVFNPTMKWILHATDHVEESSGAPGSLSTGIPQ